MIRTLVLFALVAVSSSVASAASVTRVFDGRINTAAGAGVAGLAAGTQFNLVVNFDDNGTLTGWVNTLDLVVRSTFSGGFWSVNDNGANDQLFVTGIVAAGPGAVGNFSFSGTGGNVTAANTNNLAALDGLLSSPNAISFPTGFSFSVNSGGGVYIGNITSVPEPSAAGCLALLCAVGSALGFRRRKQNLN